MAVTGLIPPIPTPLADGEVDSDSLGRLVQALAPHVDGYLVGGSVGEHPSLTVEERLIAIQVVARQKQARHRLVVSIGDNALPNVRRLSQAAEAIEADLVVLSVPNYFANTLPGLEAYLRAVASSRTVSYVSMTILLLLTPYYRSLISRHWRRLNPGSRISR